MPPPGVPKQSSAETEDSIVQLAADDPVATAEAEARTALEEARATLEAARVAAKAAEDEHQLRLLAANTARAAEHDRRMEEYNLEKFRQSSLKEMRTARTQFNSATNEFLNYLKVDDGAMNQEKALILLEKVQESYNLLRDIREGMEMLLTVAQLDKVNSERNYLLEIKVQMDNSLLQWDKRFPRKFQTPSPVLPRNTHKAPTQNSEEWNFGSDRTPLPKPLRRPEGVRPPFLTDTKPEGWCGAPRPPTPPNEGIDALEALRQKEAAVLQGNDEVTDLRHRLLLAEAQLKAEQDRNLKLDDELSSIRGAEPYEVGGYIASATKANYKILNDIPEPFNGDRHSFNFWFQRWQIAESKMKKMNFTGYEIFFQLKKVVSGEPLSSLNINVVTDQTYIDTINRFRTLYCDECMVHMHLFLELMKMPRMSDNATSLHNGYNAIYRIHQNLKDANFTSDELFFLVFVALSQNSLSPRTHAAWTKKKQEHIDSAATIGISGITVADYIEVIANSYRASVDYQSYKGPPKTQNPDSHRTQNPNSRENKPISTLGAYATQHSSETKKPTIKCIFGCSDLHESQFKCPILKDKNLDIQKAVKLVFAAKACLKCLRITNPPHRADACTFVGDCKCGSKHARALCTKKKEKKEDEKPSSDQTKKD